MPLPLTAQALEPNSLAARSGKLCVGDLLHAVNEQPVTTHEEATLALRAVEGEITLQISGRIKIDAMSAETAELEAAKAEAAEAEDAEQAPPERASPAAAAVEESQAKQEEQGQQQLLQSAPETL